MNKKTSGATGIDLALSPKRQHCLKDAATLLGAPAEVAQQFADIGATAIEGFAFHVLPMGPADGAWLASVQFPRPPEVSEPVWLDALLVANGQAMLVDDMAFSLEENGDGVLLMRLPPELDDGRFLAARLEGMLSMCRGVCAGAVACAQVPQCEGASA